MRLDTNISAVRWAIVGFAAAVSMLAIALDAAAASPVALSSLTGSPAQGTWRALNGTEITIAPCEQDLCGAITWVVVPKKNADLCRATDKTAFASLMLDYSNPDKSLQTRPILGMNILTLKRTNDPTSFSAKVYNPQDGSTNDVQIFILNGGTILKIGGGCIGSLCVQSQDWPKVPDHADGPGFTCEGGE